MIIQTNKRINYNVPQRLVNQIRIAAAQQGMEPYYWIHKVLERAVKETFREGSRGQVAGSRE